MRKDRGAFVMNTNGRINNLLTLLRIWDVALIVVAAFGIYLGAAALVVGKWQVMPPELERLVEVSKFLDHQAELEAGGSIYFLGSSIVFEGIDCDVVDRFLTNGRRSYNLAWTGASCRQWLLVLPSVAASNPDTVVLCVGTPSLSKPRKISEARLNIAAWWNFLSEEDLEAFSGILDTDEVEFLTSSRPLQLIRFRALPLGAFDSYLRETARRDLRYSGFTTNFKSPWVRMKASSPAALERHVKSIRENLAKGTDDDRTQATSVFRSVLEYVSRMDAGVVVIHVPTNPMLAGPGESEIIERTRSILASQCEDAGVEFLDYSELLTADDFSDGFHPFSKGREKLSARIGADLTRLAATSGD
jgi:lysophospholipase L1-like esterase